MLVCVRVLVTQLGVSSKIKLCMISPSEEQFGGLCGDLVFHDLVIIHRAHRGAGDEAGLGLGAAGFELQDRVGPQPLQGGIQPPGARFRVTRGHKAGQFGLEVPARFAIAGLGKITLGDGHPREGESCNYKC